MIEATLTEWAESSGKDYKTLKTWFQRAGIDLERGQKLTLLQFMAACMTDERAAKVRNLELDAKEKELRIAKEEGRLFEPEVIQGIVDKVGAYNRQAMLAMRAELPPRCNPQSPKTALTAIDQWLDRYWPEMRAQIQALAASEVQSSQESVPSSEAG